MSKSLKCMRWGKIKQADIKPKWLNDMQLTLIKNSHSSLVDHLKKCYFFSDFKFGFRCSRSTAELLIVHLIEFLGLRYGTIQANVLDIYKAFDRLSVVCWSSSQTQIFWNFRSDCWHYFTEIWGSKWLVNFDFSAGKVQLVCLTSLITMVLLMSKLMGLFLKKNILLRCWNFLSLLN